MKLRIFKALWGMTGPMPEQLKRIKEAGYDGIEVWVAAFSLSSAEWIRLVEEYQLQLIVAAAIEDADSLQRQLTELAAFQPLKINVQGGRDSMTWAEGCRFLEEALRVEATLGVPVLHETHRGKLFFNPWTTAAYLREFERIKITADYSHWVNVCERLPDDQAEVLMLAKQRAQHIHGRVGSTFMGAWVMPKARRCQTPPRRNTPPSWPGTNSSGIRFISGVQMPEQKPSPSHRSRNLHLHTGVRPAGVSPHPALYPRTCCRFVDDLPVGGEPRPPAVESCNGITSSR